MAKPNLGKILNVVSDPMLSDQFVLEFPNVPVGNQYEEPFMIQCQQAIKPGMTINEVQVQLFGHTLVYAGNLTYSHDMSVTFVENVRGTILRGLEKWAEICRKHDTQHGAFKKDYARNAYLSIFDNTGALVLKYAIYNVWPSQVPDMQLDGTNATAISHNVSFKYDYYSVVGGYAM